MSQLIINVNGCIEIVYSGEQTGRPNLEIWKGSDKVAEFVQKKTQGWYAGFHVGVVDFLFHCELKKAVCGIIF